VATLRAALKPDGDSMPEDHPRRRTPVTDDGNVLCPVAGRFGILLI